jgi:hypothetical protein
MDGRPAVVQLDDARFSRGIRAGRKTTNAEAKEEQRGEQVRPLCSDLVWGV